MRNRSFDLFFTLKPFKIVELTGNGIGVDGVQALCNTLGINSSLNGIYLGSWKMKDGQNREDCEQGNEITGNEIGDEGVKILCDALETNTNILYLYIGSEDCR